jgi:hypothetical protein
MTVINAEMVEFLQDRLDMTEDEAIQFASDLEDHGIETEEQFDDAYYGSFDSEKEFAEEFYTDMMGQIDSNHPLYSFINWQEVWDCQLRYDFVEIDGYFFRNI